MLPTGVVASGEDVQLDDSAIANWEIAAVESGTVFSCTIFSPGSTGKLQAPSFLRKFSKIMRGFFGQGQQRG